jgi:hypothetical protein
MAAAAAARALGGAQSLAGRRARRGGRSRVRRGGRGAPSRRPGGGAQSFLDRPPAPTYEPREPPCALFRPVIASTRPPPPRPRPGPGLTRFCASSVTPGPRGGRCRPRARPARAPQVSWALDSAAPRPYSAPQAAWAMRACDLRAWEGRRRAAAARGTRRCALSAAAAAALRSSRRPPPAGGPADRPPAHARSQARTGAPPRMARGVAGR